MSLAPIALFVYNRADHAKQTITNLLKTAEAAHTDLYIFSDGPRSEKETVKVQEVRNYIHTVTGFASVTIVEQPKNIGLSRSILSGVSMVLDKHGKMIQIDDDLIVSPWCLKYFNDALDHYEHDDRVACVCGFLYPVRKPVPPAFFMRGADCAIWATWKRAWTIFEADGQKLLQEIERRKLSFKFDFHGAYPYTQMLRDQIAGKNDSWAIRWHAAAFLQNKYTLYPGQSMAHNIGMDSSGTNCGTSSDYDVEIGTSPIPVENLPVVQSPQAFRAFKDFFIGMNKYSWFKRKRKRFKRWVRYIFTGA
ncbi:glycosyltransferase [Chitinophaga solisilvae]|uniref:glycosyltransferase n=1 Tax=Chitinophaga solisilvae TaxID=1233460 RepID=UPI0013691A0B|nr:glycosyltransferase [Chitinophaga solisilvae]